MTLVPRFNSNVVTIDIFLGSPNSEGVRCTYHSVSSAPAPRYRSFLYSCRPIGYGDSQDEKLPSRRVFLQAPCNCPGRSVFIMNVEEHLRASSKLTSVSTKFRVLWTFGILNLLAGRREYRLARGRADAPGLHLAARTAYHVQRNMELLERFAAREA